MPQDEAKVETEPCHTQLWSALAHLDGALDEFHVLYEKLAGEDTPTKETAEKQPAPPFATVLVRAAKRVNDACENVHTLRADFEKLCLHGTGS